MIENDKPIFMPITDILRKSVDETVALLLLELKIKLGELETDWQYSSLEKIFIEERIYKDKEFEEGESIDQVVVHVRKRLEPFLPELIRPVTDDDINFCWRSR